MFFGKAKDHKSNIDNNCH